MLRCEDIPEWKREALALLPWTLVSTPAAFLILRELEDWPSRDPLATAQGAYLEAASRLAEVLGKVVDARNKAKGEASKNSQKDLP